MPRILFRPSLSAYGRRHTWRRFGRSTRRSCAWGKDWDRRRGIGSPLSRRSWLQGLNSGDPTGAGYLQTARRLERPGNALDELPSEARRAIEQAYATIEITDSVSSLAGHQVGALRSYSGQLQRGVDALQDDVLNGLERYHELTAILDKVAAGELLGRRQDMAANQLLSHALEALLVRGKRLRDSDVANMNIRLGELRDGRAASASLVAGAGEDLRSWRQP
jgi:hypothetical protein